MDAANNLQRQHRKLQGMGFDLVKAAMLPFTDVGEVRRLLARFSGTLRMHAAMEEEALYPELLASPDPVVRSTAEKLHEELGGLYQRWDAFMERWADTNAIGGARFAFRVDLARVLTTLGRRMKREDEQLYPLVERMRSSS